MKLCPTVVDLRQGGFIAPTPLSFVSKHDFKVILHILGLERVIKLKNNHKTNPYAFKIFMKMKTKLIKNKA